MKGLYKPVRIQSIVEKVPGFKTFIFEEGHGITYRSGQYLTLVRKVNNEEIRRSYSITSSPFLNEPLSIGVKRMDNGIFSRQLVDHSKAGDILQTTGAGGFFTLPDNVLSYNTLFFFAAGSGITPVYSLVKTVLHQYPQLRIVLVYSNATPAKTIFLDELQQLADTFSNFRIQFLFSDHAQLSKARLHRDLLLELIRFKPEAPVEETIYYICGPESYMRMCTYTLQEQGVPHENIRKENFNIALPPKSMNLPPDKDSHEVTIFMGEEVHIIQVNYPDTILMSAKKQGLVLPYSCEVGRCGNCAAKCTAGNIWHSYNEVLTDRELEAGWILTCTGHPVNTNASLVIV